jgi:thiamine-monophosphate kinase
MGIVPAGQAMRRSGARAGDDVYVSGHVGDAALGLRLALQQWHDDLAAEAQTLALARLHRPQPRLALGLALRGLATSCLDVSDGLAQDLGHLLAASQVGAELQLERLPRSAALAAIDPAFADILALTGGDDYELLFTAAPSASASIAALPVTCTRIGTITAAPGLRLMRDGQLLDMPVTGFNHF